MSFVFLDSVGHEKTNESDALEAANAALHPCAGGEHCTSGGECEHDESGHHQVYNSNSHNNNNNNNYNYYNNYNNDAPSAPPLLSREVENVLNEVVAGIEVLETLKFRTMHLLRTAVHQQSSKGSAQPGQAASRRNSLNVGGPTDVPRRASLRNRPQRLSFGGPTGMFNQMSEKGDRGTMHLKHAMFDAMSSEREHVRAMYRKGEGFVRKFGSAKGPNNGDRHYSTTGSEYSDDQEDWPACVQLRPQLQRDSTGVRSKNSADERIVSKMSRKVISKVALRVSQEPEHPVRKCCGLFSTTLPFDPDTKGIIIFDIIGIIVLLHDVVLTPFEYAFDIPVKGALAAFSFTALLYWTMDFASKWITGFYRNGELIMERRQIYRNYLMTWFLPDIIVMISDYLVLFLEIAGEENGPGFSRSYNFVRIIKACRLLRILRLARLPQKTSKILAMGLDQGTRSLVQGFNILFGVLIYVHLVCCYWCAIGRGAPSDTGTSWLDSAAFGKVTPDGETLRDVSFWFVYLSGVHWTLAQITPGPIDIVATNSIEKVFNCAFLVSGLMFNGLIVSVFSGHIMQHVMRKRERTTKIEAVRLFLKQHDIGMHLSTRVQKQVIGRMQQEPSLQIQDVPALDNIASSLKKELMWEVVSPHMLTHMVWKVFYDLDAKEMQTLCDEAVDTVGIASQEELFEIHAFAEATFHLIRGAVVYRYDEHRNAEGALLDEEEVEPGTWMSEAALWTVWFYQGTAEAIKPCTVLRILPEKFCKGLSRGGIASYVVMQYGIAFHRRVVAAAPPHAPYPNDLRVPYTETSNLLSFHVSLGLLENALQDHSVQVPVEHLDALRKEIRGEQCTMFRASNGNLERVVTIVILRLKRLLADDVLTRVGVIMDGTVQAKCDLPATKQATGEAPHQALQRVLDKELSNVASHCRISEVTQESNKVHSERYGMLTTYHKIIHHAVVASFEEDDFHPPIVDVSEHLRGDSPLASRPFYLVNDVSKPRRQFVYTWLSEDEFNYLSSPEGQEEWGEWLQRALPTTADVPVSPTHSV